MKRVLVVGGLGFIGSHLVPALKSAGYYVVVVDNRSQNVTESSPADQVINLKAEYLTSNFFAGWEFDYIIHAASPAGPARIKPGYALQQIIATTEAALETAEILGAKLIKLSTSEVYGRADVELTESTPCVISPPFDARSEYQVGFIAAETMILNHPHPDAQILRLFNVVGRGQSVKSGAVIPRFCAQAKAGEPLTIFGGGSQRRTFTAVEDVVDFILLLMKWDWAKLGKGIWNVANPENETTIRDLADRISTKHTSLWPWDISDYYRDGVEKARVRIDKAMSLGWKPKVDLQEIIRRCLE